MHFGHVLVCRVGVFLALLSAGCAAGEQLGNWDGPAAPAKAATEKWNFGDNKSATVLASQHYRIYTTIEDDEVLAHLPQIMEGAMAQYRLVAPGVKVTDNKPLDCFIFRWRTEWDAYTQRYTGHDAKVYLQIRSGGYTTGDRYIAYYIGRESTFSVAAHEGWHQFAGRYFAGRLPPFFEEGMACMFESIQWKNDLPRFNLSVNPARAQMLRRAVEGKHIIPLEKLCAMHAGDIVGESNEKIDTFYAQAWAFARFLWEGDGGKWRPLMQKWIADTAAGDVLRDPSGSHKRAHRPWNRGAVKPMIEHYLQSDVTSIDKAYQAYIRKIAYEELGAQWRSN